MPFDKKKIYRISELLLRLNEGQVDDAEMQEIRDFALTGKDAVEYCVEFLMNNSYFVQGGQIGFRHDIQVEPSLILDDPSTEQLDGLLEALAEYENIVPTTKPEKRPAKAKEFVPVRVIRTEKRVSKFPIYTLVVSAAAMLFILIMVKLPPSEPPVVAMLIDQIGTQWQTEPLETGGELASGDYYLSKGVVKIGLLQGAELIIQAPAEFELESKNQMLLLTGKISATVSEEARGFVVRTPEATIVDYGTEFGVEVNRDGRTEAHVFKGEVELREGSDPVVHGLAKMLTKNMMCYVDSSGRLGEAKSLARPSRFIREVPKSIGYGFAGERLDLADIVGGGNGYGTGTQEQAIDPITGKITSEFVYKPRKGRGGFIPVDSLPYIDGVFVPDGEQGPVAVSSYGDLFDGCIDTARACFRNISNGFRKGAGVHQFRGLMNGVEYGTLQKPAISMHSNTGLTFDLNQIRQGTPGMKITAFDALCGISGNINQLGKFKAVFYVLVDGEKRFEIAGLHKELLDIPVRVELSDKDRFLTLIAADGGDTCANDWCVFAMPVLELVRTE
jgi:hypothetical protein